MNWVNILLAQTVFVFFALFGLGILKLPQFLRRKRLVKGFPWGYYNDKIPKNDPGFISDGNDDFLHNVSTSFDGMPGFGEYGQFTGFGEMGEF